MDNQVKNVSMSVEEPDGHTITVSVDISNPHIREIHRVYLAFLYAQGYTPSQELHDEIG